MGGKIQTDYNTIYTGAEIRISYYHLHFPNSLISIISHFSRDMLQVSLVNNNVCPQNKTNFMLWGDLDTVFSEISLLTMHYKSETHQHLRQFQVTHPRDVTSPGNKDNTLLLISENILQRVKLCYSLSHNKLIQFYTTRITVQTILHTILASHLINYFAQFSPHLHLPFLLQQLLQCSQC